MPTLNQRYLIDAVLQQLRSGPAAAAFGDTWNPSTLLGVEKFTADFAEGDIFLGKIFFYGNGL